MVIVYSDGIPFNTPSPSQSRLMVLEHWAVGLCLKIFGFSGNGPQNGNHSAEWQPFGTIAKELVPIICSCVVWVSQLARKSILIQCDNLSLVMAINKGSCRDKLVMQLSGILTFFVAHFDMHITYTYISGTLNVSADHLS